MGNKNSNHAADIAKINRRRLIFRNLVGRAEVMNPNYAIFRIARSIAKHESAIFRIARSIAKHELRDLPNDALDREAGIDNCTRRTLTTRMIGR